MALKIVNLNLASDKMEEIWLSWVLWGIQGGLWDCVKLIIGFQKGLVGLCRTYYGMLRGRAKGRGREWSGWTGEEKAWENQWMERAAYMLAGWQSVHLSDWALCLITAVRPILLLNTTFIYFFYVISIFILCGYVCLVQGLNSSYAPMSNCQQLVCVCMWVEKSKHQHLEKELWTAGPIGISRRKQGLWGSKCE